MPQQGAPSLRLREVWERAEWNAAVEALGGSITQSWEWGLFHQRQGWKPLRLLDGESRGAVQLLLKAAPRRGAVAYAAYGPLAASTSELIEVTESAACWARGYGAYLLKIEPRLGVEAIQETLKAGRYVRAPRELPARTRILGIPKDPEEHLKALPKDLRYKIRRAYRNGVEVLTLSSSSPDIDIEMEKFLKLLKDTSERQGFWTAPDAFYRNVMRDLPSHLLLAYHEGTPVAALITAIFGEEAYYLFGASTTEKGNLYAPHLLQWEAMEVARRAGCSRYDMWGISSRPPSKTRGFVRFKQQFGGTVEEYAGAYFWVPSYLEILKHGAVPSVARATRFAIKRHPNARKVRGEVSVHWDTGEPPQGEVGSRHQPAEYRQSVKEMAVLGVYYLTRAAYAQAFASGDAKARSGPVLGPPAPFLSTRTGLPPDAIATYRQRLLKRIASVKRVVWWWSGTSG